MLKRVGVLVIIGMSLICLTKIISDYANRMRVVECPNCREVFLYEH